MKCIADDVVLGRNVQVWSFVNLYGCTIGDETRIGSFVEIQKGVRIGSRCKISSHSFVCEGVEIEDEVFVGHHVTFINDRSPRACNDDGSLRAVGDWNCLHTRVCRSASIGSGSTILGGLTIGEGAMIGAGSVVTKDVPPFATVVGSAARVLVPKVSNESQWLSS